MEGAYKIKYGTLKTFSEQQLLDCTNSYGNAGCGGGAMQGCYKYLKSYKMMTGSSYPYVAYQKKCSYNSASGIVNAAGYVDVTKNDPNAHINAIARGPVSAAIQATSSIFQFYKGGIISSTSCGTSLNHAVLLIGYGADASGNKYWLLKNSWGSSWGESGYFRIARSTSSGPGICGVLSWSSYPTL